MNDIRIPDWQSRGRGWETLHILLKSPLKNTNFSPTYADDLHLEQSFCYSIPTQTFCYTTIENFHSTQMLYKNFLRYPLVNIHHFIPDFIAIDSHTVLTSTL